MGNNLILFYLCNIISNLSLFVNKESGILIYKIPNIVNLNRFKLLYLGCLNHLLNKKMKSNSTIMMIKIINQMILIKQNINIFLLLEMKEKKNFFLHNHYNL